MAIHPTPDLLEITYERLRLTKPFIHWKLPHADDIIFQVVNDPNVFGEFCFDTVNKKKKVIRISYVVVRSLDKLDEVMAHEMCHMREQQLRARSDVKHGRVFQRLADQVCSHHGFRRGTF